MQNNITTCQKFEFTLLEGGDWPGTRLDYTGVLHISGKWELDRKELKEKVKLGIDNMDNAYVLNSASDWTKIKGKTCSFIGDSLTLEILSTGVLNNMLNRIEGILVRGCEYLIWLELWEGDEGIVTPVRIKVNP